MPLSDKSVVILRLLANGYGHDQVLLANPSWTLRDIFSAAAEALELDAQASAPRDKSRGGAPNAFAPWRYGDDWDLRALLANGDSIPEIAIKMGRTQAAISRRISKLGYFRDVGES